MTRKSRKSNKRKKSDSSICKSGDTPSGKINMAAPMSQQQQQVDTSQILAQLMIRYIDLRNVCLAP
jgi:hypothetical protein